MCLAKETRVPFLPSSQHGPGVSPQDRLLAFLILYQLYPTEANFSEAHQASPTQPPLLGEKRHPGLGGLQYWWDF